MAFDVFFDNINGIGFTSSRFFTDETIFSYFGIIEKLFEKRDEKTLEMKLKDLLYNKQP